MNFPSSCPDSFYPLIPTSQTGQSEEENLPSPLPLRLLVMDRNLGRDPLDANNRSYALGGKIMLAAIIILFFVVALLFSLHLYARWYRLGARRRHLRSRRRSYRRPHIVFYVDPSSSATPHANQGLDERVLNSLPVFTFSSKTYPHSAPECAVCLSEFEENESGRTLPKCNHSFHIDCIDMWFHSHSTCPLCRTPVEGHQSENPGDVRLSIPGPIANGAGSALDSGFCIACESEDLVGTSSSENPRKLSVDVPMRHGQGFEGDSSGLDSGTSQSFRSPMGRMLSFRRMLSRERRQSPCPSPGIVGNCGSDLERGREETRVTQ